MQNSRLTARLFAMGALILAVFIGPATRGGGAESNAPAATAPEKNTVESSADTLRTYLQLQEQLHATQLALERNREEALEAAARNSDALGLRLQSIEGSLAAQRARELEAMQASNRVMLIVAGSFAGVGFVAMLLMAVFQWRAFSRLADISAALPVARSFPALGPGDTALAQLGHADQANLRLLGALDRLEKRIRTLESTTHPAMKPALDSPAETPGEPVETEGSGDGKAAQPNGSTTSEHGRLTLLLAKGQSFLNSEQPNEALACFTEALGINPENTEALVKKGSALERLRRWDEAMACYDRALVIDESLTIAYLYKGGLFNRMEHFNEALECYEKALRTQEKQALQQETAASN